MKWYREMDKQFKESRANVFLFRKSLGEGRAHPRSGETAINQLLGGRTTRSFPGNSLRKGSKFVVSNTPVPTDY